jgi:hypothetical protein
MLRVIDPKTGHRLAQYDGRTGHSARWSSDRTVTTDLAFGHNGMNSSAIGPIASLHGDAAIWSLSDQSEPLAKCYYRTAFMSTRP